MPIPRLCSLFRALVSPLLAAMILSACAAAPAPRARSDHFDGERFFNPWMGPIDKSFGDLMKWWLGGTRAEWPERVPLAPKPAPLPPEGRGASVTFVNHATFVLRFAAAESTPGADALDANVSGAFDGGAPATRHDSGVTLLIDPVWSQRVSPLSWIGPKRAHEPGVRWNALPRVDVVLVSHNHYDHMDMPTLKRLAERDDPLFLVPLGDACLLREQGIARVEELDWWQERSVRGVAISFLPSQHWSNRAGKERNTSLWGSWGVTGLDGTRVYHAGDTGYGPHFALIAERWGAADLALLPIGAYEPRWFLREQHTNPAEAVRAARDLRATRGAGMHFGTFRLADERYEQPGADLRAAADAAGQPFLVPEPGQTIFVEPRSRFSRRQPPGLADSSRDEP